MFDLNAMIAWAKEKAETHERELFTDWQALPDDEFEILLSNMAHADQLESLAALHAFKVQGLGVSNTATC